MSVAARVGIVVLLGWLAVVLPAWYGGFIIECGRFPVGGGEMWNWLLGLSTC